MPVSQAYVQTSRRFAWPGWIDRGADWIKAHPRTILAIGILLQLLVLSSMIVMYAAPLVFGERILLRVQPVDPRDLFRGDYVILAYDFSRVPPEGIDGLKAPTTWQAHRDSDGWWEDRTVYASLEPEEDGKHYRLKSLSLERPASGRYLKGKFVDRWGNNLSFGIEAFYVQEGEGKALEQLRNSNQLSAEIALAPWGQATLCRVE